MPQLDKFTFLDQSLTILFFFLVIYILSLYLFLPKILFIIRFRSRLFNILKYRSITLSDLLNNKLAKLRLTSKRRFSILYSISNFILLQLKELTRVVRLISFKI